jgi:DNA transposition AAA+ family ATPase
MNDPANQPIDIEEQREWLIDHRLSLQLSWALLAKRVDIPVGTLSQFGSKRGYAGDERRLAERVYTYRNMLDQQASIDAEAPELPGYYETETSRQITNLLRWAQRGRIVVAATGAGLGKSTTARQFVACYPNVYIITLAPSSAGVANMQQEMLAAMGEPNAVGAAEADTADQGQAGGYRSPLLIVDEAQHGTQKTFEEIRHWNDAVGVGVALFGNMSVLNTLEGGGRRDAFAQLYSRVSMRMLRAAAAWRRGCDGNRLEGHP